MQVQKQTVQQFTAYLRLQKKENTKKTPIQLLIASLKSLQMILKTLEQNIITNVLRRRALKLAQILINSKAAKQRRIIIIKNVQWFKIKYQSFIQMFKITQQAQILEPFYLQGSVRGILLDIYLELKYGKRNGKQRYVFIARVDDMSIDEFQRIINFLNVHDCIIVVHDLQNQLPFNRFRDVIYELYQQKNLFCQYMLQCITDNRIMAYLPRKSLSLIQMFQDYPICFQQGVRRLNYLIQKMHITKTKTKTKTNIIDKQLLIKIVLEKIQKILEPFYSTQKLREKFIYLLLDDWSHLLLDSLRYQDDDIVLMNKSILQMFSNLNIDHTKIKRQDTKILSLKGQFQDRVAFIIKYVSMQIRQQALIYGQTMNYEKRMCPMIPYDIVNSLKDKNKQIYDIISKNCQTYLPNLCCQAQNRKIELKQGQLQYILTDLQILGLIQIHHHKGMLSFINNYFPMANYNTLNKIRIPRSQIRLSKIQETQQQHFRNRKDRLSKIQETQQQQHFRNRKDRLSKIQQTQQQQHFRNRKGRLSKIQETQQQYFRNKKGRFISKYAEKKRQERHI